MIDRTAFWAPKARILALALALSAAALPAAAQVAARGDAPLDIAADQSLEWLRDEKAYVARGDVVAKRGDETLYADLLIARYRELPDGATQIYRIEAEGDVRMESPARSVHGDKGVYDVDKGQVVVTGGDLRLVTANETVTARDRLVWNEAAQTASAVGAARATRGANELRAETLVAHFEPNAAGEMTMTRIVGEGGVVVTTPTDVARGDQGAYDVAQEVARLEGNVKLTRGGTQLNGAEAEVDMKSGVSRLLGGGGRVRGLIVPGQTPEIGR